MLQAHVCGDASAVVSEEALPKLLVVNHMASLCFHTPLHRVLYRHKGWKKSGMRDVQTSRESWQLHPCSSLSANFTKAKPLEEPSGNRLMSTLSTCSCFHLEHDFLRLAAPGQCPGRAKKVGKDPEKKSDSFGLIFIHVHWILLSLLHWIQKPSGDPAWPYFAKWPMTLSSLVLFRRPPTKTVVTSARRSFNLKGHLPRSHDTFLRLPTYHHSCWSKDVKSTILRFFPLIKDSTVRLRLEGGAQSLQAWESNMKLSHGPMNKPGTNLTC